MQLSSWQQWKPETKLQPRRQVSAALQWRALALQSEARALWVRVFPQSLQGNIVAITALQSTKISSLKILQESLGIPVA